MIYFSMQIWPPPDADDPCVMSSMYNIIPSSQSINYVRNCDEA